MYVKIKPWVGVAVGVFLIFSVPAMARNLTVCESGCEFTSIQKAVEAAHAAGGDVISVAPGQYIGPVQIDKNIELFGVGTNPSTIVGGLVVGGIDILVRLDGLTLTQGLNGLAILGSARVIVQNSLITRNFSDGVLSMDETTVTLFNTVVSDNGTVLSGNPIGAGILAKDNSQVSAAIVTVSGNVNAGVVVQGQATLELSALTEVTGNGAVEGLMPGILIPGILVFEAATINLNAVLVKNNAGGGIAILEDASARILNSQVFDNGGVGIQVGGLSAGRFDAPHSATATVENTKVSGNAGFGILVGDPAVSFDTTVVTLRQNGITKNERCGVGIDLETASPTLLGNFIFDNAEQQTCNL